MRELLEDDYLVMQLFVEPSDTGHHGIQRKRTFIYCSHRVTGRYLFDIHEAYNYIKEKLSMHIRTRPRDYLVATDFEIRLAAQQAAYDRGVAYRHAACLREGFRRDVVGVLSLCLLGS